jgi:hypothetical protein
MAELMKGDACRFRPIDPQCRNYLRATGKPLCLVINFGRPKVEIRRVSAQARSRKPSPLSLLIPRHPP